MAMINIVLSMFLLELLRVQGLPEETYVNYPMNSEEDMYLYMDQRSESDPKISETRRRSTLDKNFARFGRGDLSPLLGYDLDELEDTFSRPTRSGEKNDHFIRFGRGKSDFVRFGRDRNVDRHFIRFGRNKGRNKRDADYFKRAGGSHFVRFGRNDNFMRFGREPERVNFVAPTSSKKLPQDGAARQSNDSRNDYILSLILDMLKTENQHPRLA